MIKIVPLDKVYISKSLIPKAGHGVFAGKNIKKGEIIEQCPILILPLKDYPLVKKTILRNYYFMWGKKTSAICFGYGSFYNHSYEPNTTYRKKIKEQMIEFIAIKDINKNEEIIVNYNYSKLKDRSKLWIKEIKPFRESMG